MATMSRITGLGRNTRITRDNEETAVVLHGTSVVRVSHAGIVTLDSGGYRTFTTKARMNQAAWELRLGYRVYQDDYSWFVSYAGNDRVPFYDGISFPTS